MARIRTIKPEFPQSESMGRVSRDSRLCFVLMWTIADDAGRLRGNPRMLASLLYPYDDDAKKLIGKWLDELELERCIKRYEVGGDQYIQINAWLTHQKIDKPSVSKIPPPPDAQKEDSRGFANSREGSTADQGRDQGGERNLAPSELVDRDADAEQPYRVPPCPYEDIANAYAEKLPQLPQLAVLTDLRRGHMNARWREVCAAERFSVVDGLAYFADFFAHCAKSAFLTGNAAPGKDGRVWKADFDWLMLPTNFVKVVEGRYHGKRAA